MKMVTIWDGETIRTVPENEAKELIALGKAQATQGLHGLQYKTRDELGYDTRELRAKDKRKRGRPRKAAHLDG